MIKQKLKDDLSVFMKSGEKIKRDNVRMMINCIQTAEKDAMRELSNEEVVDLLTTFKKQNTEEMNQYIKANNADRATFLKENIEQITTYLPQQLTGEEITSLVLNGIKEMNDSGLPVNIGSMMKALKPLVKGKADGKLVNEIVKKYI